MTRAVAALAVLALAMPAEAASRLRSRGSPPIRLPLITPDANAVAHVYWTSTGLVDAKGNTWTMVGSVPQVAGTRRLPPGAGPMSGTALYRITGTGLNFAGDFTAVVVAKITATTGTFALPLVTGTGSVGYFGGVVQSSGRVRAQFYPGASVDTGATVTVDSPFVIVFGRASSAYYVKVSGGTSNRSLLGTYTAGTTAATIGTGLGGNAFPGVVYEVYATTTPFSDALASGIIAQAGARMRRPLAWTADSSSVAPGPVLALGDSITNGSLVTTPYPTTLLAALGAGWSMTNAGVNNERVDQMNTRWLSTYRGTGKKWVVLLGGVNDIIQGAATADVIISRLLPLYESILKDGARLVPVTILPWKDHANWTTGRQTITEEVNAWIAWWCLTHGVPYVDAYNSALNDGTGALAAAYDTGDHIHPNQAGTDYLATLIRAAFP